MKKGSYVVSGFAFLAAYVAGCGSSAEPSPDTNESTGQSSEAQCGGGAIAGCGPCYPEPGSSLGGLETCVHGCTGISKTYECVPPPPCGGFNEPCCPDTYTTIPCAVGAVCKSNTCEQCGGENQPCCTNDACGNSTLSCSDGQCVTCGQHGAPCCANDGCDVADICESGVCQTWVYYPPPTGSFPFSKEGAEPRRSDAAAPAGPGKTPQIIPIELPLTVHEYVVSIDNFWVTYPRSKNQDTVTAGISMGWADGSVNPPTLAYTPEIHKYVSVGNVAHGGVNLDDFSATMDIPNTSLVKIGVGLENVGSGNDATGRVSDYVVWSEWTHSLFGIGPVWPANSAFTNDDTTGETASLCDGIVAGDGAIQSGAELEALTANGPYTRTEMFPGTDSPVGCGRNSLYYMTWTITRSW